MTDDERRARTKIDQLLTDAGWVLQDRNELDRHAALGVADQAGRYMGGLPVAVR